MPKSDLLSVCGITFFVTLISYRLIDADDGILFHKELQNLLLSEAAQAVSPDKSNDLEMHQKTRLCGRGDGIHMLPLSFYAFAPVYDGTVSEA